MKIQELLYAGVNLLFPSSCPACKTSVSKYPSPICPDCRYKLLSGVIPPIFSLPYITKIFSCTSYDAMAERCIKEFKYHRMASMMNVFNELIQKTITKENFFRNELIDIIVPIPIHWIRLQKRGFNQAEIIAKNISKMSSLPLNFKILIKVKNTMPQAGLSKISRKSNLKNSFLISKTNYIKGKNILLVDDVITTGATLDTCAKALLRAGAKEVMGFALAKTMQ